MKGISILIIATLFLQTYGFSTENLQEENTENNRYEQFLTYWKHRGEEDGSTNTWKWKLSTTDKNNDDNESSQNKDDGEENSDNEEHNEIEDTNENLDETGEESDWKNLQKIHSNKINIKNHTSSEKNSSDDDSNESDSKETHSGKGSSQKDYSRRNSDEEDTDENNSSDNTSDEKKKWEKKLKKYLEHVIKIQKRIQSKLENTNNTTDQRTASTGNFTSSQESKWINQGILNIRNILSEVEQEEAEELIRKYKKDYVLAGISGISLIENGGNWTTGNNSAVKQFLDTLLKLKVNNELLQSLLSQWNNEVSGQGNDTVQTTTSASDEFAVSTSTTIIQTENDGASVSISVSTGLNAITEGVMIKEKEQQPEIIASSVDGKNQSTLNNPEIYTEPDDNRTVIFVSQGNEIQLQPQLTTSDGNPNSTISWSSPQENEDQNSSDVTTINSNDNVTTESSNIESSSENSSNTATNIDETSMAVTVEDQTENSVSEDQEGTTSENQTS